MTNTVVNDLDCSNLSKCQKLISMVALTSLQQNVMVGRENITEML